MSQTLSVLSHDPDTTRRPSGEMATHSTYDEARSSQKHSGRRNAPNPSALQASPRTAGRHVPDLERVVARRRNDAPPVRKHGNALDLRRSQIITKVQWTPQRTLSECPSSVATHSPVATSPDLERLVARRRHDAPPVRKHGNALGPASKPDHHKSTADAATHVVASALSASPRIRRSPRPTP